ncbi:MIP/aquaporin family protein [Arthrobacter sp. ov118]|uniref:MIP/aquaporin family protein n=1 Tax=Arthrobacter sp. ov118 TaxID=1761747 RepID=UPI0008EED244|nr:aquaporin [Arthrobacter sp. ov118]SFU14286.1 aquaporin Z [Arthrobacter sp. ov118]
MTLLVPAPESVGVQPAASNDSPPRPRLAARLSAEAFGTLIIVVAGLGVPLFTIPQSNPLPAALAAGLALTAAMLAVGYVSGGHFNPAVTVGNVIVGRIKPGAAAAYIGAQLAGAALGAAALFGVLCTVPTITDSQGAFATVAAGFGEHSVIQVPMAGVLLMEVLGTALLVAVFLATTASRSPATAAAPFAVGLTAAVLLQFGQALGNVPFNPARATASAIFSGPNALGQLWLFWVAPLVGAAIAALVFRGFGQPTAAAVPRTDRLSARNNAAAEHTDNEQDSAFDDAELADAEFEDAELDDAELTAKSNAKPAVAKPDVAKSADPKLDDGVGPASDSRAGSSAADDEARSFFDSKR